MKRSDFIKRGALAGIGLPVVLKVKEPTPLINLFTPEKHHFLEEVTIAELQDKMASGELSAQKIVKAYLQRIQEIDKGEIHLNSVIELNPDALQIAEKLDQERKSGKVRGPLHGIPVLIKDNIDTGDKMMTTSGSSALVGNKAKEDAFIIHKLREEGAVVLGKTNLSEFANYRSTRSQSGWSSRGGQTRNAYVLDRNPLGSSSGSGAAVAANLCTIAIGTETNGSIISPSAVHALVGIKPTVGLWSRSGIIPISSTQDTAGPMARTVKDAAILLSRLAGVDPKDEATLQVKDKEKKDYSQHLSEGALEGKRIGVDPVFLERGHYKLTSLFQKSIDLIKEKGAEVVFLKDFMTAMRAPATASSKVLRYEFKTGLNTYLKHAQSAVHSLSEIIAYNQKHAQEAMPFFGQEILLEADETDGIQSADYPLSLAQSTFSREIINTLMAEHSLDAICGYSRGPSGCIDLVNGDYGTGDMGFTTPAAISGFPNITVPMGFVHELPVGISFMGKAFSEAVLIQIAYAYEQATHARQTPKFIKSISF